MQSVAKHLNLVIDPALLARPKGEGGKLNDLMINLQLDRHPRVCGDLISISSLLEWFTRTNKTDPEQLSGRRIIFCGRRLLRLMENHPRKEEFIKNNIFSNEFFSKRNLLRVNHPSITLQSPFNYPSNPMVFQWLFSRVSLKRSFTDILLNRYWIATQGILKEQWLDIG